MPTLDPRGLALLAESDWGHMDFDGGGWIAMGIGMILFWGLLIFGVVWLVREVGGHSLAGRTTAGPDALEILDRRFAEGDISVKEYEERRRVLRNAD